MGNNMSGGSLESVLVAPAVNVVFREQDDVAEPTKQRLQEAFARITGNYQPIGYNLTGANIVTYDGGGQYVGRDEKGIANIKIGKRFIRDDAAMGVYAHEQGHDIFAELVLPKIKEDTLTLVASTLGECFADLNALNFGYEHGITRNPFKATYTSAFGRLAEALSVKGRDKELELCDKISDALKEKQFGDVVKLVEKLEAILFYERVCVLDLDGTVNQSNLFLSNIGYVEEINSVKRAISINARNAASGKNYVRDILRNEQTLFKEVMKKDENYMAVQREIEEAKVQRLSVEKGKRKIEERFPPFKISASSIFSIEPLPYEKDPEYAALEAEHKQITSRLSFLYDKESQVVEKIVLDNMGDVFGKRTEDLVSKLRRKVEETKSLLEGLHAKGGIANLVLRSIGNEKYGNQDESVSFPHEVGGKLARELYNKGIMPTDIVKNPEQYLALCEEMIKETIEEWLNRVSSHAENKIELIAA